MTLNDGTEFDSLKNVYTQDFKLETIAPALSKICRYSGHCNIMYSVAQHSIFVHDLVKYWTKNQSHDLLLAALLHDAHEALTGYGDVCSLVKPNTLRLLEGYINEVIAKKLNIKVELFKCRLVKQADKVVGAYECQYLMPFVPEHVQEYLIDAGNIINPIEEDWRVVSERFNNLLESYKCTR